MGVLAAETRDAHERRRPQARVHRAPVGFMRCGPTEAPMNVIGLLDLSAQVGQDSIACFRMPSTQDAQVPVSPGDGLIAAMVELACGIALDEGDESVNGVGAGPGPECDDRTAPAARVVAAEQSRRKIDEPHAVGLSDPIWGGDPVRELPVAEGRLVGMQLGWTGCDGVKGDPRSRRDNADRQGNSLPSNLHDGPVNGRPRLPILERGARPVPGGRRLAGLHSRGGR